MDVGISFMENASLLRVKVGMLKAIDQKIYQDEVRGQGKNALLCFVKDSVSADHSLADLEELSRQMHGLVFYVAIEEDYEFFYEVFNFVGTPLYILLENGGERGRLFGVVSMDRLRAFIVKGLGQGPAV